MYGWYRQSGLCYVYLNDVPHAGAFVANSKAGNRVPFECSQWHTRGWTLQELLAPTSIHFYSKEWVRLDADPKVDIHKHISQATGIGIDILKGSVPIHSTSIAKRMSWASQRQTTRTEDMAYCLLGIFDVNMPMLYGEGPKAFIRLQEEIMKTSKDETLFVWTHVKDDPAQTGLLARHPQNFRYSADFEDKSQLPEFTGSEYRAAREGVFLNLFLDQDETAAVSVQVGSAQPQIHTAVLRCAERDGADRFAAIQLIKYGAQYMRQKQTKLQPSRLTGLQTDVFIRNQIPPQPANKLKQEYVRILFETNCPHTYIFAMPSKSGAPPPLYRSKKARAAAEPALALNVQLAAQIADQFDGRRLTSLDEGEIPLRKLTISRREIFFPMDFELGYNLPINDLKWTLPLLPKSVIAYMRIVPGVEQRYCRGVSIGIDANARLGFCSGHNARDEAVTDNICRTPIGFAGEYSLFFHHKQFDQPTAGDEIAEVKISLRHHARSDKKLQSTDVWEHKPGLDNCPCQTVMN